MLLLLAAAALPQQAPTTATTQPLGTKPLLRLLLLLCGCLLLPAYWYAFHCPYLREMPRSPQLFAEAHFKPLTQLQALGFLPSLKLLIRKPFLEQFPMFLARV